MMSDSSRVLILEPELAGHHIRYLEWLVFGALERGFKVVIVTFEENSKNHRLIALQQKNPENLDVLFLPRAGVPEVGKSSQEYVLRELLFLRWAKKAVRSATRNMKVSVIILPYMDYFLHALAISIRQFDGIPWIGIAMRPSFHLQRMGLVGPRRSFFAALKEMLFFHLLTKPALKKVLSIDPVLVEYVSKVGGDRKKISYLADPTEVLPQVDRGYAREKLGIPNDRFILLLYGAIDYRKGLVELLDAVADNRVPVNVVVYIVGVSDSVQDYLSSSVPSSLRASGRLFEHNAYVSDAEEAIAFSASDAVWVGYKGHFGMSGVLVQAAHFGIPALCCTEGIIAHMCKTNNLGITVAVNDRDSIVSGIIGLMEKNTEYRANDAFCRQHSRDQFLSTVYNGI